MGRIFDTSQMEAKRNWNRNPADAGETLVAPGTVENQLKLGSLIPFYGLSEGAGSASRK